MKKNKKDKVNTETSSNYMIKTGKFTIDETEALNNAIDKYIDENFNCSRDKALFEMIKKRGNLPSPLTIIGKKVLPNRHSRSIYNYFRRHILVHQTGKWSDSELMLLLKTYFYKNDNENNCWKDVAKKLNRSPEQIHDKYRELKPSIHHYKSLIMNKNLTEEELINGISKITKDIRNNIKKNRTDQCILDTEMQQKLYDYIRSIVSKDKNKESIENIPWAKVQKEFPNFSVTKLRIHFNMTLLPKVYSLVYPGFGPRMVSRLSIRWIRKLLKRPNSRLYRSINDVDFRIKFPQLPVIYIRHCTRRILKKSVNRYSNQLKKPHKYILDSELSDVDKEDLKKLSQNSLRDIFTNKNFNRIVKFAYNDMEVKRWKKIDKYILKQIKKDLLPECSLYI